MSEKEWPILASHNLTMAYGDQVVFENVTLPFAANTVTAIIGASGCGKSSYLRCLNRMNEAISPISTIVGGVVRFHNQSIYDPGVYVPSLRHSVGMIFQKPVLFPGTVFDNVAYGPRLHNVRDRSILEEIVECCLRQAHLWEAIKDRLNQSALELSGGEQQRLCIARALAVQPEVLLMDEPCSALDPIATQRIESLIEELRPAVTIVIVTHNIAQAKRIADNVAFLDFDHELRRGYMCEYGECLQVIDNPVQERTFLFTTGRFG